MTAGLSIVGYLQFGTIGMTAAVAGVSLLITTLEGSLLTPMLMGRDESSGSIRRLAVLELGLGYLGNASSRTHDDGSQGHLRSR